MEITQVPKSLTDISIMCGERSQPHLNKAEDNGRPRADYFWLKLGKAALDVWPGGGRKGRGGARAMASEPTCHQSQTTPWQRPSAVTRWMTASVRAIREGGESLQRPAWHSRLGEQIPLLPLFSKASCWHRHFGAPAEESTADLRPEQHYPWKRTGRSAPCSQDENAQPFLAEDGRWEAWKHSGNTWTLDALKVENVNLI